jgi:hypothetical protein
VDRSQLPPITKNGRNASGDAAAGGSLVQLDTTLTLNV